MQRSVFQILFVIFLMVIKNSVDLLRLIKKMADCSVVVKSINDISNVLAHINLGVPLSFKKLGRSVYKIGSEYLVDNSLLVSLVKILETVAEKTEGCEYEDALCSLVLKLLCNVDNRVTR